MAVLIVAGDATINDVAQGKRFCAGTIYNGVGTATGGVETNDVYYFKFVDGNNIIDKRNATLDIPE